MEGNYVLEYQRKSGDVVYETFEESEKEQMRERSEALKADADVVALIYNPCRMDRYVIKHDRTFYETAFAEKKAEIKRLEAV